MIFEKTLPNGLELIIKKTSAPVAAFQVWVDVGSIDESASEAGYCHFLEHMLFKGTKKRSTAQIAGTIEGSGGDMNAFTSFEHTVYHITGSNSRWEISNEILADMVLGSVFKKKEFDPEKEVILEEMKRSEDSPDRQLYENVYGLMYGKVGYGRPVIGFHSTVSNCSETKLKSFWNKWYAPSLMTLVIVGDVDVKRVEEKVLKTWGSVKKKAPRKRRREIGYPFPIHSSKKTMHTKHFPVNSIRWAGSFLSCTNMDPILPALDVGAMVLGHGETSRLHRRLFRDEKLVTSVSASVWAPIGVGMYNFDIETPVEHASKFRKSLNEEIKRMCQEGPNEEELERTKVIYETDRIYAAQSMDDIAQRLGYLKTTTGNVFSDLDYAAEVLDVTAEDVKQVSKSFFESRVMNECALLPKDFEAKMFWKDAVSVPAKKSTIKPLPAKSERASGIEKISLPNGIELLLCYRPDLPLLAVQTSVLGGLRFENKDNNGISNLLCDVWEKGPKGMGAEKFSAYLEKHASRIDSFSGRNSLGLSSTMLTKYSHQILKLFVDTLTQPALEEKELNHARDLSLEDIRTLEDNPARLCGKLFAETLFEGHPYQFTTTGSEASLKSISTANVHDYYNTCINQKKLVVSVCGKYDQTQIVSTFENIKRNHALANAPKLSHIGPKASRVVEIKKNREQSHVIVGFKGITIDDDRRFTLRVMNTLLGGQSGRLFTEIRDKQGLCYTVSPISLEGIETGYVGVYIGCDPNKRDQAIKSIHIELDKMMSKPVSKNELARSKEFLLGRHHMDMQLNGNIASTTALNVLYGLSHLEHLQWEEQLATIDAKKIQDLAKNLFSAPCITSIVV